MTLLLLQLVVNWQVFTINLVYVSALSLSNADKEFSRHETVSERKNKMTAKDFTATAEIRQRIEPKTDMMTVEVSSEKKHDEAKKQDDNINIFAARQTCTRDCKEEKFPRFVESDSLYDIILCYHLTTVRPHYS